MFDTEKLQTSSLTESKNRLLIYSEKSTVYIKYFVSSSNFVDPTNVKEDRISAVDFALIYSIEKIIC